MTFRNHRSQHICNSNVTLCSISCKFSDNISVCFVEIASKGDVAIDNVLYQVHFNSLRWTDLFTEVKQKKLRQATEGLLYCPNYADKQF